MDRRKLRISPGLIGALVVVLALIIGITAWMNARNVKEYSDIQIAICMDGTEVAAFTMEELTEMETTSASVSFTSQKNEDENGTWTGVPIAELLKEAGLEEGQYESVVFSAGDGYSSAAEAGEINAVLLAWEKDGESLASPEEGGTGPMRCIFTEDAFGQRSIGNVVKIDCKP